MLARAPLVSSITRLFETDVRRIALSTAQGFDDRALLYELGNHLAVARDQILEVRALGGLRTSGAIS
jgi:hypothetical protein